MNSGCATGVGIKIEVLKLCSCWRVTGLGIPRGTPRTTEEQQNDGCNSCLVTPFHIETLEGSFSAVSTHLITTVRGFFRMFRDLENHVDPELLKNAPTLAIRGVDTAENEPSKVSMK